MPKVSLSAVDDAATSAPPGIAVGHIETRILFNREKDPLHLNQHRLDRDAELRFDALPANSFLYLLEGSVTLDGAALDACASALVEQGATPLAKAGPDGATLLMFAGNPDNNSGVGQGRSHVLPSGKVLRKTNAGEGTAIALFANLGLDSCPLWMHEVYYPGTGSEKLHSHSADEIIYVTEGHIRLGNRTFGPGLALAIAGNTKYTFAYGPDGLRFLNFRVEPSVYSLADGSIVSDERKLWQKMLGTPEYSEPQSA